MISKIRRVLQGVLPFGSGRSEDAPQLDIRLVGRTRH